MTDRKKLARQIFRDTLGAIDIAATLEQKLRPSAGMIHAGELCVTLREYRDILVISLGKAATALAQGMDAILAPEFRYRGILAGPSKPENLPACWEAIASGHPVPNAESFRAGRVILEALRKSGAGTLVIFLLSGGGSSLVELPLDENVPLEDFVKLHETLVTCGAPIEDINVIRKHLSAVKGGRMASAASDAMKLTFGVTDVPEGQESALASGPTLPDPTTVADAERIARQFGILKKLPARLLAKFERSELEETPKAGDRAFAKAHFELLLGRHDLFHHAHIAAEAAGFFTVCDNATDGWPVEKAAGHLLQEIDRIARANSGRPVALIADGEVSSPVTGRGKGGRNSAFALACVERISGRDVTVLSAGTDGIDGNSPAAGAVADGATLVRAHQVGMNPAEFYRNSDAFTFFERVGDAIITGPTGNNLRDLRILLAG